MQNLDENELSSVNGGNPVLGFLAGYVGGKVVDYYIDYYANGRYKDYGKPHPNSGLGIYGGHHF